MAKLRNSKDTRINKETDTIHQRYEGHDVDNGSNKSSKKAEPDFILYLYKSKKSEQIKKIKDTKDLEDWFEAVSKNYLEEESISDIKYLVVVLDNSSKRIWLINVIKKIVRGKYDCRFPVVFNIGKDDFKTFFYTSGGNDEFLRTYGLGQFLYSEKEGRFLTPIGETSVQYYKERTGKYDHDKNIDEFMKAKLHLSDLQMEHLRMYVKPENRIPLLRHNGLNAWNLTTLEKYEKDLADLLKEEDIKNHHDITEETQSVSNQTSDMSSEPEHAPDTVAQSEKQGDLEKRKATFKQKCDKAEVEITKQRSGVMNKKPIYALLLDDIWDNSALHLNTFIDAAEKQAITIVPVKTVAEAEDELVNPKLLKERLKSKHKGTAEAESGEKDLRYTVVLVDLLLKEAHSEKESASESNPWLSQLVSQRQGYDFVRELAEKGRSYGVILLSTLPRNFKVQVAGALPMRTRNFPYKDGGKLANPDYQQILIDMIVEAHEEVNEEAVFRAFTQRGYAMHYIRYMNQHKGFEDVEKKAQDAIMKFQEAYKPDGQTSQDEQEKWNKVNSFLTCTVFKNYLTGLSSELSAMLNKDDLDDAIDSFLNDLYTWSWKEYVDLGCPESSEHVMQDLVDYCTRQCREQYYVEKKKEEEKTESDSDENNSRRGRKKVERVYPVEKANIIAEFVKHCYSHKDLSLATILALFKNRADLRDFVARLYIYKNVTTTPKDDKLQVRFTARLIALYFFFWANLSKEANKYYVGKKIGEHELTSTDCVNQILNKKGINPKEYPTVKEHLTTSGVWLYSIAFNREKDTECPYMTPYERQFFLELFRNEKFQFDLKEDDDTLNEILNTLGSKPTKKMCGELIYYFKKSRKEA